MRSTSAARTPGLFGSPFPAPRRLPVTYGRVVCAPELPTDQKWACWPIRAVESPDSCPKTGREPACCEASAQSRRFFSESVRSTWRQLGAGSSSTQLRRRLPTLRSHHTCRLLPRLNRAAFGFHASSRTTSHYTWTEQRSLLGALVAHRSPTFAGHLGCDVLVAFLSATRAHFARLGYQPK
jgi:hypothetical protein